jgi:hypothetical protein
MVNRRLVNLAMTDYKNRMFSLHRMDLSKLLFYPSTAEAEAACGCGRGCADQSKPPKIGKLRLPPPIMGFEPCPTSSDPWLCPCCSMFVLLHGRRGLSSEASRILFTSSEGKATMYDVDSRSVISVPDLTEPMGYTDIIPIVTGAGAGEETLYAMRYYDSEFKVLDFSGGEDKSRASFTMNESSSLRWQSLPPLPVEAANISSFTVVDSDRIICVTAGRKHSPYYACGQDSSTFCFDTVSQEWWETGDWVLPFDGKAEYVPELETWLGFSRDHPHHLCAVDLSGVAMAPRQAPTLQHVWEDYNPPPTEKTSLVLNKDYPGIILTTRVDWSVTQRFLVNLGSGRFCVAKVVDGEKSVSLSWSVADSHEKPMGTLTVLTGVEVIRDGGDGELRMVKHKSRELVHYGLEVACVL